MHFYYWFIYVLHIPFVYNTQNLKFLLAALWSELLNLWRGLLAVICQRVILKKLLCLGPSKEQQQQQKKPQTKKSTNKQKTKKLTEKACDK